MSVASQRKNLKQKHLLSNNANQYVHAKETRSAGLAKSERYMFYGISHGGKDIGVYLAQNENSYVLDNTGNRIYGPFQSLDEAMSFSSTVFGVKKLTTPIIREEC
jgi:hypothetical protein